MSTKHAFVTVLSTENYLDGVGALALSLNKWGKTTIPLYVLCGPGISEKSRSILASIKNTHVSQYSESFKISESIKNANISRGNDNWNHTFDKLQIFELTQFDKIVYIDADMMVMQNIDSLFTYQHISATNAGVSYPGNEDWITLNSGIMVIEPQKGLAEEIIQVLPQVISSKKAIGDQDLLHVYYSEWPLHPELNIGERYNIFVFQDYLDYYIGKLGYHWGGQDSQSIAVLHFIGYPKPWDHKSSLAKTIYQEIRRMYLTLCGQRKTQWAILEYKHLIRVFRRNYKV